MSNTRPCGQHGHPNPSTIATVSTLHLLLRPIAQLHETCTRLAHAALCQPSPSELELAFRNEARSAFLWLTCFLDDAETQTWMATRGCPNCVVERVLSCDSTVRMVLTAALVAKARAEKMDAAVDVPDLSFFLDVMKHALEGDAFWGPGFYADLLIKAEKLSVGVQAMVAQAAELEILVSSPSPSPTASRVEVPPLPLPRSSIIPLKVSPMARRQQNLRREEEAHLLSLQRLAWQVNSSVALTKSERMVLRGGAGVPRKRSMTWQG